MNMSKAGFSNHLINVCGEQFSPAAARYAADILGETYLMA